MTYDIAHSSTYPSSVVLPVLGGVAASTPLPACPSLRAQQSLKSATIRSLWGTKATIRYGEKVKDIDLRRGESASVDFSR